MTDATKKYVPSPAPPDLPSTSAVRGTWLAEDEEVEWICDALGDIIGFNIYKKGELYLRAGMVILK
jgi:hypothetical protein